MTQKKYVFLEGMRGIAAVFVILSHVGVVRYCSNPFVRNYLAVDLFFVLSGFVIAHAYDERLKKGQIFVQEFILRRLIRLYPIFLISWASCIAIGVTLPHNTSNFLLSALLTIFFLPHHLPGLQGGLNFFPLNGVYWTIFFEIILNLIYALTRPILSVLFLAVIASVMAMGLIWETFHNGNLNIGYYWGGFSMMTGFTRALFGFAMGVLIFRWHTVFYPTAISWLSLGIMISTLAYPQANSWNAVVDITAVLIIFPTCIFFSLQTPSKKASVLLSLLGASSYPLYLLHVPVFKMVFLFTRIPLCSTLPLVTACVVLLVFSILLNYYYDIPTQRWLKNRLLKRAA